MALHLNMDALILNNSNSCISPIFISKYYNQITVIGPGSEVRKGLPGVLATQSFMLWAPHTSDGAPSPLNSPLYLEYHQLNQIHFFLAVLYFKKISHRWYSIFHCFHVLEDGANFHNLETFFRLLVQNFSYFCNRWILQCQRSVYDDLYSFLAFRPFIYSNKSIFLFFWCYACYSLLIQVILVIYFLLHLENICSLSCKKLVVVCECIKTCLPQRKLNLPNIIRQTLKQIHKQVSQYSCLFLLQKCLQSNLN